MNFLRIIVLIASLWMVSGCVPQAKLTFQCDDNINGDMLLPVDIILVSQGEEKAILQIGPDAWFESEYRNNLTKGQLIKLALKGKEEKEIKVNVPQKESVAIIFADYTQITDQNLQQIIIYPHKWRKYIQGYIRVGEHGLQIVK
ncbi:MAG: hypothetical protein ABH870_02925 [bacterium]